MAQKVGGRDLRVTNLDKVLYPSTGTTKGAVIEYYLAIAPVLLPLARDRPVTRKRWVNGVGTAAEPEKPFFRKDLEEGAPEWVPRVAYQHKTRTNTYPLAHEPATLAWFGQLAALELHVPQWRFDDEGNRLNPDRLVLDLDPGAGAGLAECVEVALACKELLDDMGLESVPVTSGSKGIHLYAELDGTLTSDDASAVAKRLAGAIAEENPDLATANMRKDLRRGKVLIDWSQNNAAKTTICPYSLRGTPRPHVAAPRTWAELREGGLTQLSFRQVLQRVESGMNPLEDFGPGAKKARKRAPRAGKQQRDTSEDDDEGRLAQYRAKRDAERTPEPFPGPDPGKTDEPVFVIQRHEARRLHWDFRLERDGALVSWAVPKGPPLEPRDNRLAVLTEDHPLEYATFEGEIPKGEYGGGRVEIWDAGTIKIEKWEEGKEVIAVLYPSRGGGLGGIPRRYALIHTGSKRDKQDRNWLIHLMKNQPAPAPKLAQPLPKPMLATRATTPMLNQIAAGEEEWSYEMKWDGIRAIAQAGAEGVRVMSRRGHDITGTYPELAELSSLTRGNVVVDGEIVALNTRGVPDFGVLQRRMNLSSPGRIATEQAHTPVYYFVFDLLESGGKSLLEEPYDRRRADLFDRVRPGEHVAIPSAEAAGLDTAMATSRELGLEGVVAKKEDSTYAPGIRSENWVKLKHELHQEVVVAGWRPNERGAMASLILGIPENGELIYAGRVGTGFSEQDRHQIPGELTPISGDSTPLTGVPAEVARDARWVEPTRVGEVRYAEVTAHGSLRHPAWRGWREDKDPAEIQRE